MKITELTRDLYSAACAHFAAGARAGLVTGHLVRISFADVKVITSGIDHISPAVGD